MTRRFEAFRDRLARKQRDFMFAGPATAEDCDSHLPGTIFGRQSSGSADGSVDADAAGVAAGGAAVRFVLADRDHDG